MTNDKKNTKYEILNTKYLLFIGRLEERKNIVGIIKAFETLKENYKVSHKLVLAGKPGYGYEKIKQEMENVNCRKDIVELGYVSEEEKQELLKNAAVFLFPSFYEGFGLPILEAQNAGCPVVTSNVSSIPEVVMCHSERTLSEHRRVEGEVEESRAQISRQARDDIHNYSALLVDPHNAEDIADAIYKIISDEKIKKDLIQKGLENVKRFGWEKCAKEIAEILRS